MTLLPKTVNMEIEVCRCFILLSSPEVQLQNFSQVGVWTSTGPMQPGFFSLTSIDFFFKFVAEPAIIGLLIPSLILMCRYLTFTYIILWYREEFIFFAHKYSCLLLHSSLCMISCKIKTITFRDDPVITLLNLTPSYAVHPFWRFSHLSVLNTWNWK